MPLFFGRNVVGDKMFRKILVSSIFALGAPLFAIEVYKGKNSSLRVFGTLNTAIGYGNTANYTGANPSASAIYGQSKHRFMIGVQKNSKFGVGFNIGGLFGEARLGLMESPVYKGGSGTTPNFRRLYLGYDFGSGGALLIGKSKLPSSLGGFINDIFNAEGKLRGFGGSSTNTRRFQVQYSVAGFEMAISNNDANLTKTTTKAIPRFSLAYQYLSAKLLTRLTASYTCYGYCGGVDKNSTNSKHIAYSAFGIKPIFGNSYLSLVLHYGLNTHLVGEHRLYINPTIQKEISSIGNLYLINNQNALQPIGTGNIQIFGVASEFGHSFGIVGLKIGLGYQLATSYHGTQGKYDKLHSYGAYLQVPLTFNQYVALISQVGALGTAQKDLAQNATIMNLNTMAMMLLKLSF